MAANIIEPANTESAWAFGNQIMKGYSGVLTAKPTKNPIHKTFWKSELISYKDNNWKLFYFSFILEPPKKLE